MACLLQLQVVLFRRETWCEDFEELALMHGNGWRDFYDLTDQAHTASSSNEGVAEDFEELALIWSVSEDRRSSCPPALEFEI